MEMMTNNETEYFNWLYNKAFITDRYRELAMFLFKSAFDYVVPMDENRYENGMALRYKFGIDLGDTPCSMLEMMVRLAEDIEGILDNNEDDRTYEWIWIMLDNSGLSKFDDNYIYYYGDLAIEELQHKIVALNFREYPTNGEGSFFPTQRNVDMRRVELWHQANWYIADNNIH